MVATYLCACCWFMIQGFRVEGTNFVCTNPLIANFLQSTQQIHIHKALTFQKALVFDQCAKSCQTHVLQQTY
jgi:hypothetical protein